MLHSTKGGSSYRYIRSFLLSFILLGASVAHVAAIDLWNGFTTDMTKDDVIKKAIETLDIEQTPKESSDVKDRLEVFSRGAQTEVVQSGSSSDKFITNKEFVEYPYDDRYSVVKVYSNQPTYRQYSLFANEPANICFYFYKTKLYGVQIKRAIENADLVFLTKRNHGEITATLIDTGVNNQYTKTISMVDGNGVITMWKLLDKLCYVNGGQIIYVDSTIIAEWIARADRSYLKE